MSLSRASFFIINTDNAVVSLKKNPQNAANKKAPPARGAFLTNNEEISSLL
jgi:hypothetical protein